jgi:hypothetical protein
MRAQAQLSDATIKGTINDTSGNALEGVKINIHGSNKVIYSKPDGSYVLTVKEGAAYLLDFEYFKIKVQRGTDHKLEAGEQYELNVTMRSVELDAIRVNTATKRHMQAITPRMYGTLPSVGHFESVLKTLPGVSSNNELSSQYSVRGGNYDENLVYIDDIEIYRPQLVRSGQQEGLSIIHSDLIRSVEFSAGGFEARYGDKLSSVLDLTYKEPDSFAAKAGMSFLGGSVSLEGSSDNHRFTFLGAARYRSTQYLLGTLDVEGTYRPTFTDVQTYMTYDIRDNLKIALLSYFGRNRYLSVPESQTTPFGTASNTVQLRIFFDGKEILQQQTLLDGITLSWKPSVKNRYKFISSVYAGQEHESFDIIGQYFLEELENDVNSDRFGEVKNVFGVGGYLNHARNRLRTTIYNAEVKGYHTPAARVKSCAGCPVPDPPKAWQRQIDLEWGMKVQHEQIQDKLSEYQYMDSVDYSLPQDGDSVLNVYEYIYTVNNQAWNRYMGYIQNSLVLSRDYNAYLTVGVRGNYWDYTGELLISPRFQFSFEPNAKYNRSIDIAEADPSLKRNALRLRLTGGVYNQAPFYRELRNLTGQLNPEIRAQKSKQIVAGSDYTFTMWGRPFKWTTEVYYKQLTDVIPYEIDNVRVRYFAENNAKGYAAGMDMQINGEFIKDNPSWFNIGFLKTAENLSDDNYTKEDKDGNVQTVYPGYIPRPTDQRFRAGVFVQDYLPGNESYKVHLMGVYGSRLPFGPPDHNRYRDTLRMRPYRRVDVGFSKQLFDKSDTSKSQPHFLRHFQSIWLSAEVFNMFGFDNTVSYLWVKDIRNQSWAVPSFLTDRRLNLRLELKF